MKKGFIVCLLALVTMFAVSCGGGSSPAKSSNGNIKIVVTTFPIYDWVSNILGDNIKNVELSMIIDSGVDLHSFQPSSNDIIEIANADLFIYNGGVSEKWAVDAINQSSNKDIVTLNLIETLGNRVIFDHHGHDHDEDHDDDHHDHDHDADHNDHHDHDADHHDHDDDHNDHHDHDHDHDHHAHGHDDEHIWLSLINAQIFVDAITASLSKLDPSNAGLYYENAAKYNEQLKALDEEYKNVISSKSKNTIVVGDRFPFVYMFEDYGLKHFAAFSGCSAETEASFDVIKSLAEKVDEINTKTIVKTDGTTHNIAETIKNATKAKNQDIITFNSIEYITADKVGTTDYISIMKKNLESIEQALTY